MKRWIKILLSIVVLVLFDQVSKFCAVQTLRGNEPIALIKNVLELRYLENRGAAFGIFQEKQWMFILITGGVILALLVLLPKIPEEKRYLPLKICLTVLASGAVGNLIDRVVQKYVVDFIYFRLIDFPIFNVADIYVTVSVIVLLYLLIFYYKEAELERIWPSDDKKKGNI